MWFRVYLGSSNPHCLLEIQNWNSHRSSTSTLRVSDLPHTKNSHVSCWWKIVSVLQIVKPSKHVLASSISEHYPLVFCVFSLVQSLLPWRPTHPNATGTVWISSWTVWPACCPSPRRSEVAWTNCRCSGSVWDTSRLRVTSMVSDFYLIYTCFVSTDRNLRKLRAFSYL